MTPEQRSDITNGIWLCATHATLIDRDEVCYSAEILRQMKNDHENRVSAELSGVANSRSNIDFVTIGPDLVFTGELIRIDGFEWRLRIGHFLIGDLATLIKFSERFDSISPYDRYILVNTLGDGRQLSTAPVWQKTDNGYIVSCQVHASFPRTNAYNFPKSMALNDSHDIFSINGNFAMVSGLAALSQEIKTCLSVRRGEVMFAREFGSRIKEHFDLFLDSPWLMHLIKLEVIRMASIPYSDSTSQKEYTPLRSVLRVLSIEQLTTEKNGNRIPFRFHLEVEGVGSWQCDISILI